MKRKILVFIIALVVILSTLGALYYTSYPIIGVSKAIGYANDKFEDEFHSETITIVTVGTDIIPDSPLQSKKMDAVWQWNDKIGKELAELRKDGGLAYNIKVSGKIANGKTTLRYEGYIIKKDGERINYLQEKTFDFVLCSKKNFLTNKL